MENPRHNPMKIAVLGHGESAISLGPKKLGQLLAKCLSETDLLMSMPPGLHSQNVLRILKKNLQQMMGTIPLDEG